MAKKKNKNIREKGKIQLSEYFKELKDGQKVAIVKEKSVSNNLPERVVGLVGLVVGSQGEYKIVELKDGNKTKRFIIHPIHLKILK
jgi:ribosomal protein L21E